ncbi:hypothetical protein NUW54_g13152 [Trametes sanguinea]|uniref:Uncharacterized protein n=1 Tax=Trametes sanguinea TaxID=158606 RepID=A0ACC1MQU8_9APHY|nr:hypothetical protein NUW54_g13152 [Trametes sanguinea]
MRLAKLAKTAKLLSEVFTLSSLLSLRSEGRPTLAKTHRRRSPSQGTRHEPSASPPFRVLPSAGGFDASTLPCIPKDGNVHSEEAKWTLEEQRRFDEALKGWARWEVNVVQEFVKARGCQGTTMNISGICDACEALAEKDKAFRKAVYRVSPLCCHSNEQIYISHPGGDDEQKKKESELDDDEQHLRHVRREKYAPNTFKMTEARELDAKLSDPVVFRVWKVLNRNDPVGTFILLLQQAREGKLANKQTFLSLCSVFSQQVERRSSHNPKAKNGMRYPRDFMNFMVLMRSYGQRSAQQYAILHDALAAPCARTLRYVIKRSPDCLSNPDIDFENVARVKRLMDSLKYTGPVAVAGDCTKVRARLMFSNDFGNHILGSTLPLEDAAVSSTEDIESIVARVAREDKYATQVRAILVKVNTQYYYTSLHLYNHAYLHKP